MLTSERVLKLRWKIWGIVIPLAPTDPERRVMRRASGEQVVCRGPDVWRLGRLGGRRGPTAAGHLGCGKRILGNDKRVARRKFVEATAGRQGKRLVGWTRSRQGS